MTDYVDREELIDRLCEADAVTVRGIRIINEMPREPVPVVHGEWENVEISHEEELDVASMQCSECKLWNNHVYFYGGPASHANYCQFCGAQMREDDGGGD